MRGAVAVLALVALCGCLKEECRDGAVVPFGEYAMVNNQHGKWRLANEDTYAQCVGVDAAGWPVTWRWECNTAAVGVKGYPQILYGWNPWGARTATAQLPRYVGDISTLRVTHDARINGGGAYNVCFDLWFTKAEVPTPDSRLLELMVWTVTYAPIAGERVGTLEAGGNLWAVYLATKEGEPPLLMFIAATHYTAGVTDFEPFFKWALDSKVLSRDSYLACIEFGSEVTRGSGTAKVNGYRVDMGAEVKP